MYVSLYGLRKLLYPAILVGVSMLVADGRAPQDICNSHDHVGWLQKTTLTFCKILKTQSMSYSY